jgi:hypothetical protein
MNIYSFKTYTNIRSGRHGCRPHAWCAETLVEAATRPTKYRRGRRVEIMDAVALAAERLERFVAAFKGRLLTLRSKNS